MKLAFIAETLHRKPRKPRKNNDNGFNDHLRCSECSYVYSSLSKLNRHLREVHLVVKQHQCIECGKFYRRKEHRDRHVEAIHLQENESLESYLAKFNTPHVPPLKKSRLAKRKRMEEVLELLSKRKLAKAISSGLSLKQTTSKVDPLKKMVSVQENPRKDEKSLEEASSEKPTSELIQPTPQVHEASFQNHPNQPNTQSAFENSEFCFQGYSPVPSGHPPPLNHFYYGMKYHLPQVPFYPKRMAFFQSPTPFMHPCHPMPHHYPRFPPHFNAFGGAQPTSFQPQFQYHHHYYYHTSLTASVTGQNQPQVPFPNQPICPPQMASQDFERMKGARI